MSKFDVTALDRGKRVSPFSQTRVDYTASDAERIMRALSERYAPIKIEPFGTEKRASMQSSAGVFSNIKINSSTYAHGLNVIPQQQYDGIFFIFPLSGFVESCESRGLISASEGAAIASEGATCKRLGLSPGHAHLAVTIDRAFFIERLAVLLERAFAPDVLFEPVLNPRSGRYDAVKALVSCVNSWEFGEALSSSPRTATRMPAVIADFMLENWRHNYSHHLDRVPPLVAPKHIKLALTFIEEQDGMLASVEELAKLCDVSLRALQYGFRHFVGTSITEYQRGVRLERARTDLMKTTDSIEMIAHRWGFSNAGRFSGYFKAAYGKPPSQITRDRAPST